MNTSDLFKWDKTLYTLYSFPMLPWKKHLLPIRCWMGPKVIMDLVWELQQDVKLGKVVQHTGDNPGYHTRLKDSEKN